MSRDIVIRLDMVSGNLKTRQTMYFYTTVSIYLIEGNIMTSDIFIFLLTVSILSMFEKNVSDL